MLRSSQLQTMLPEDSIYKENILTSQDWWKEGLILQNYNYMNPVWNTESSERKL